MLQPARLKSRSGSEGRAERQHDASDGSAPRRRRPSRVGRLGRILVLLAAIVLLAGALGSIS